MAGQATNESSDHTAGNHLRYMNYMNNILNRPHYPERRPSQRLPRPATSSANFSRENVLTSAIHMSDILTTYTCATQKASNPSTISTSSGGRTVQSHYPITRVDFQRRQSASRVPKTCEKPLLADSKEQQIELLQVIQVRAFHPKPQYNPPTNRRREHHE